MDGREVLEMSDFRGSGILGICKALGEDAVDTRGGDKLKVTGRGGIFELKELSHTQQDGLMLSTLLATIREEGNSPQFEMAYNR